MTNYWYISRKHEYPSPSWHVMSVQLTRWCTIVEMQRECTEEEVERCDLLYIGHGNFNDDRIQTRIEKYKRGVSVERNISD